MQIQQTSSASANNNFAPSDNSSPRQKNWNNTIANITGLTAGLTVYTIGAAQISDSAIKTTITLNSGPASYFNESHESSLSTSLLISMLVNAVLSLTVGVFAGKATQLTLRGLQTSPQIENKISTE